MRAVRSPAPRLARAAALAATLALIACGGRGPTPPTDGGTGAPPSGDAGGPPPAGDPGGSPSAGGSGGSPSAGGSGGAQGDGGAPPAPGDGGAPGAGGGAPTPGDGGGSPPAAPGGGGSSASACAGLAPTFGDAVERQFDTGTHRDCSVATSSASGQLALGVGGSWGGFAGSMFALYSAEGVETAWVDGIVLALAGDQGQDVDPSFHETSAGWAGIVHPGNAMPLPFRTWDASGALVAEIERFAVSTAPDRNGGSLLLAQAYDPADPSSPPGPTKLEWVDAAGRLLRSVTLDRDAQLVISSWATGHVVVVVPGSPGSARWFDEGGAALTPWFEIGDVPSAPQAMASLHLLLDGSIAIRTGPRWTVVLADGVASAGPAPEWLAARPYTRLATIRGGRAYAVLPMGGTAPGDPTRFEIVTASGESCGSFSVPPAPAQPGAAKTPQRLDVGQDGTLVQQSAVALDPSAFGMHCAFRWWPALLR